MSISTTRGDQGQTNLPGGVRVSKGNLRVEAYGTFDELISSMGLARALSQTDERRGRIKSIQRELFKVGSAVATPPGSRKPRPEISDDMVTALAGHQPDLTSVGQRTQNTAGGGENPTAAAFGVAAAVCRRAERLTLQLIESGADIQPNVMRYLNSLSRLLDGCSGVVEQDASDDPI